MRLATPIHGLICLALLTSVPAHAQEPRLAFAPAARDIRVARNIRYGRADTVELRMDVYRRPGTSLKPALIFFNRGVGADRAQPLYDAWARAAASHGLVGIVPDLRSGSEARDFQLLVDHLRAHGGEYGLDGNAIAVYAASGNVFSALPAVEDSAQTAIKAAVIYYGTAPVTEFRRDLPVLLVRAGLDRPAVNEGITAMAARAVTQNAPLTLLNHPGGYHGFEIFNDDDATRDVIERTLDFVTRATSRAYLASMRTGIPEATAAGFVVAGNHRQAAALYADLVRTRPDDARLRLSFGEALLGDMQFGAACDEFEKLKGKGLGYRDLGLPAARACMQKGDADAAIAWLKSIPTRFLPSDVQQEAIFAPIQERAEFKALFPPR